MEESERKAIEEKIKTLKGLAKSEREYAKREFCSIRCDAALDRAKKYEAQIKSLRKELRKEPKGRK